MVMTATKSAYLRSIGFLGFSGPTLLFTGIFTTGAILKIRTQKDKKELVI